MTRSEKSSSKPSTAAPVRLAEMMVKLRSSATGSFALIEAKASVEGSFGSEMISSPIRSAGSSEGTPTKSVSIVMPKPKRLASFMSPVRVVGS